MSTETAPDQHQQTAAADDLVQRHGGAKHPERDCAKTRPAGVSDETVNALGTLSEALEVVENARGLLYNFHRLCGTADLTLQRAVQELRAAGHADIAEQIEGVLVGRDIVPGLWSFQLIEGYDRSYWSVFRDAEAWARERAGVNETHLFEAEMKYREQQPPD